MYYAEMSSSFLMIQWAPIVVWICEKQDIRQTSKTLSELDDWIYTVYCYRLNIMLLSKLQMHISDSTHQIEITQQLSCG